MRKTPLNISQLLPVLVSWSSQVMYEIFTGVSSNDHTLLKAFLNLAFLFFSLAFGKGLGILQFYLFSWENAYMYPDRTANPLKYMEYTKISRYVH